MKNKLTIKNILIAVTGILLLLIIIGFLARGWVRETIIPGYISSTQTNGLKSLTENEIQILQDPFSLFGYRNQKPTTECNLAYAQVFTTRIICTYKVEATQTLTQSSSSGEQIVQSGTNLLTLLEQNGWSGDYSDSPGITNISDFTTSIAKGIDSVPDATYMKRIGEESCTFSNVAASSSPDPVAMSTYFTCSKSYTLF